MELREHTDALKEEAVTVNCRVLASGEFDSKWGEPALVPHALGRFRVLGQIARGGMGLVLRAYDPGLDRELAIKLLSPGIPADSEAGRRFAQEARIVSQLSHPGIIPVYEAGTLPDGRAYFAMPFVEGETLAALLARRPDPGHELGRWLDVFERVCRTVAHAHARRVVHRDLKPSNVMVGGSGEVMVMDWGVAADVSAPRPPAPADGGYWVCGTPAYMPPEQARGRPEVADPRADVFGLGAVLCEILTGEPPYVGPDVATVTRLAADGALAEAEHRLGGCAADPRLVGLARRCLSSDPTARPADAAEVARAVTDCRAARPPAGDGRRGKWQRWTEVITAALALSASAAVGATANEFKARAERAASPPAGAGLTPDQSPPARP